jgi:hypothetical protein
LKTKISSDGVVYELKEWRLNFFLPAFIRRPDGQEGYWIPPYVPYTRYLEWREDLGRFRTVHTRLWWRFKG